MAKEILREFTRCRPLPHDLVGAERAAEKVHLSLERLVELADARIAPHYRVEGGPPLFRLIELKRWVMYNLAECCEGVDRPTAVVLHSPPAPVAERPPPYEITNVPNLRQYLGHFGVYPPAVYFLCKGDKVVYVGQSLFFPARLGEHMQEKTFDAAYYLPVPASELLAVEGAFIQALTPLLNYNQEGRLISAKADHELRNKYLGCEISCYLNDTSAPGTSELPGKQGENEAGA
jgi:hypothetical protein